MDLKLDLGHTQMRCIPESLKELLPKEVLTYPDKTQQFELEKRLAAHHGVDRSQICLGCGSSELIDILTLAYGQRVLNFVPTFFLFEFFGKKYCSEIEQIPWPWEDGSLAIDEKKLTDKTLIWICNPNNPTGNWIEPQKIIELASKTDAVVAVDENFAVFSNPDNIPVGSLPDAPSNVISLLSFSKIFGIPGQRLGYAVGHPDIISRLESLFEVYHINALSSKYGHLTLSHWSEYKILIKNVIKVRHKLEGALRAMGFGVLPSNGNWVSIRLKDAEQADFVRKTLLLDGISGITFFDFEFSYIDREPYFRLAVPTSEEYPVLLPALHKLRQTLGDPTGVAPEPTPGSLDSA